MPTETNTIPDGQESALAVAPQHTPTIMEHALTIDEVRRQHALLHDLMRTEMKVDQHYGVIPGCGDKPTLLKPGAEKITALFQLRPRLDVIQTDHPGGHREYRVRCSLYCGERFIGEGVGCCSTQESKYRYRWENTGKPVPKDYWDTRDNLLLGGSSYVARKVKSQWFIFHRVDHDTPADYYNTVLKIGKKRALVDAVLTATAASDIFTEDIENMRGNGGAKPGADEKTSDPPAEGHVNESPPPPTDGDSDQEESFTDLKTWSAQDCIDYLRELDEAAGVTVTDWEADFISSLFQQAERHDFKLSAGQRASILKMVNRYGTTPKAAQ